MRRADKMNAANVLIAGDDEFAKGRVVLRNMRNKQQEEISLANIQSVLLERKGS
jgi:histidyl-tRNA synthetase